MTETAPVPGLTGLYIGRVRWAVIQNLDLMAGGKPHVCEMDDEATARKFHKSWGAFAKQKLPNNPECWPELVAADVHWRVMSKRED